MMHSLPFKLSLSGAKNADQQQLERIMKAIKDGRMLEIPGDVFGRLGVAH